MRTSTVRSLSLVRSGGGTTRRRRWLRWRCRDGGARACSTRTRHRGWPWLRRSGPSATCPSWCCRWMRFAPWD